MIFSSVRVTYLEFRLTCICVATYSRILLKRIFLHPVWHSTTTPPCKLVVFNALRIFALPLDSYLRGKYHR
jgi:hypothetical protein